MNVFFYPSPLLDDSEYVCKAASNLKYTGGRSTLYPAYWEFFLFCFLPFGPYDPKGNVTGMLFVCLSRYIICMWGFKRTCVKRKNMHTCCFESIYKKYCISRRPKYKITEMFAFYCSYGRNISTDTIFVTMEFTVNEKKFSNVDKRTARQGSILHVDQTAEPLIYELLVDMH